MIVVGATFWKRLGAGETMGTFSPESGLSRRSRRERERVSRFHLEHNGEKTTRGHPSGVNGQQLQWGSSWPGSRGNTANQTGGLDLGEETDLGAGRRSRLCLAPDRRGGPWLVNPPTAAITRDADCGGRRIQMPLTRAQAPGVQTKPKSRGCSREAAPLRLESKHQGQKINSCSLQCKRTGGEEEGTGAWGQKSALRTCSAALSRNSGAYNKERQRAGDVADASLGNAADERIGQTASLAFGTWLDTWSTASHAAAVVEGPPDPSSVVSAAALHSLRARAMDATIMAPPPAGRQTIHPGGKSSAGRAPVAPTRPPKQACQSDVRRRRALTLSPMSGGHYAAACAPPAGGPECPCMFPPAGALPAAALKKEGLCGQWRGADAGMSSSAAAPVAPIVHDAIR
ncbi:hypothetical protein ACCO45_002312 [Purpureocillium lilacinum]|uniref:Uncharacterized protein n=1 Tax=Purpureocillium lilacinum TaxID=33203 RepID=A0ACC4EAG1_PURLI